MDPGGRCFEAGNVTGGVHALDGCRRFDARVQEEFQGRVKEKIAPVGG